MSRTILIIGTYDTKDDELTFMADTIRAQGGAVVTMDVSVLGEAAGSPDISKHDVAAEANSSIDAAIACGHHRAGAARLRARRVGSPDFRWKLAGAAGGGGRGR